MLRSAGKFFGTTAAGVAASGPASHSQCRAQQQRVSVHHGKEEPLKYPAASSDITEEWVVADLKRKIDEDEVIFDQDEVNDALQTVIDFGSGKKEHQTSKPLVHITEIDATNDSDGSEMIDSSDADLHMRAAELQLKPAIAEEDFKRMLLTLLHSQDVQSVCVRTLKSDEAFQRLISTSGISVDVPVDNFSLLPAAARQAAFTKDDENSFSKMVHDLADSLMRMGENLLEKAQEARNLLGSLLIRMGYHVHAALGKPFGRSPCEESDPERLNHNAEVVGNALVTVACAILTLVLVKRVHRIRFV